MEWNPLNFTGKFLALAIPGLLNRLRSITRRRPLLCPWRIQLNRVNSVVQSANFEQALSVSQKEPVKVLTLDMWLPFATAARTEVTGADLVYDRFHLSEHLNAAVDRTRRQENKRLSRTGDERLKQTRYLWLRAPDTLTDRQQEQLNQLCQSELETVAV